MPTGQGETFMLSAKNQLPLGSQHTLSWGSTSALIASWAIELCYIFTHHRVASRALPGAKQTPCKHLAISVLVCAFDYIVSHVPITIQLARRHTRLQCSPVVALPLFKQRLAILYCNLPWFCADSCCFGTSDMFSVDSMKTDTAQAVKDTSCRG
jgi:hypothetical protein